MHDGVAASERAPRRLRVEWQERVRDMAPMLRTVLLLWLGTRALYALVTWLADGLGLYTARPGLYGGILAWQRFDANWYLLISRLGYWTKESVNYFPLQPMLTGAIAWLLGDGSGPVYPHPDPLRLLVGMAVSNAGLLLGLLALGWLAQVEADPGDADAGSRAARMMLAFPFAMGWTIAYADGLFVGLLACSLLFARRGHWYLAALAAFLTGFTRPVAVALVLPLLWEFGQQHGWWRWPPSAAAFCPRVLLEGALAVGAVPLAMVIYFGYVSWRFGDPLLIFRNLGGDWHHVFHFQWWTVLHGVHRVLNEGHTAILAIELVLLAAFFLIVLVQIRRMPLTYTLLVLGLLYMATALPIPELPDLLWGAGRYMAGALPVYLIIARWTSGRPALDSILFGAGLMVQGVLTIALFRSDAIF